MSPGSDFSTRTSGSDEQAVDFWSMLGAGLSESHFRKRGKSWWRERDGLYGIVSLQESKWDAQKYINVGMCPSSEKPQGYLREGLCLVRFRLGAFENIDADTLQLVEAMLRAEPSHFDAAAAWRAARETVATIVSFFEWDGDVASMSRRIGTELNGRVMISKQFRDLAASARGQ